MKLPTEYTDDILGRESFGRPDDVPVVPPRVYSLIYPPIGFFPFYDIGNGDYHGYYWPVGREHGEPLVAFTSHDVGSMVPENSNITSFYRCQLARWGEDAVVDYRELVERAAGGPLEPTPGRVPGTDFGALLEIDPVSPFLLCAVGDCLVANDMLGDAERNYRAALDLLPEYVAAHFGLAIVLRRERRALEATIHLRKALLLPMALCGNSFWLETSVPGEFRNDWHRKSLMWLQRSSQRHDSLADDPFFEIVGKLTFATGVKQSDDYELLERLIDKYLERGQPHDAVNTWQLLGERAAYETSSFRERLNLTPRSFGTRLAELFAAAGLHARASLVRDMLGRLDAPDGWRLYALQGPASFVAYFRFFDRVHPPGSQLIIS